MTIDDTIRASLLATLIPNVPVPIRKKIMFQILKDLQIPLSPEDMDAVEKYIIDIEGNTRRASQDIIIQDFVANKKMPKLSRLPVGCGLCHAHIGDIEMRLSRKATERAGEKLMIQHLTTQCLTFKCIKIALQQAKRKKQSMRKQRRGHSDDHTE